MCIVMDSTCNIYDTAQLHIAYNIHIDVNIWYVIWIEQYTMHKTGDGTTYSTGLFQPINIMMTTWLLCNTFQYYDHYRLVSIKYLMSWYVNIIE